MRTYEPAAVADAIGCSAEDIRNWRKQKFLGDIGQVLGRVNVYTYEEVSVIAVGSFLGAFLKSFKNGFDFALERRNQIEDTARDVLIDLEHYDDDYILTLTLDPYLSTGFSGVTQAPVAEIDFGQSGAPAMGLLQVNISAIARRVAFGLKAWTRGQKPV